MVTCMSVLEFSIETQNFSLYSPAYYQIKFILDYKLKFLSSD